MLNSGHGRWLVSTAFHPHYIDVRAQPLITSCLKQQLFISHLDFEPDVSYLTSRVRACAHVEVCLDFQRALIGERKRVVTGEAPPSQLHLEHTVQLLPKLRFSCWPDRSLNSVWNRNPAAVLYPDVVHIESWEVCVGEVEGERARAPSWRVQWQFLKELQKTPAPNKESQLGRCSLAIERPQ